MSAGDDDGLISVKLKMASSSVADARRTEHSLLHPARHFQTSAFSIAVSPNYPSDHTLFVGTLQQGLLKSTDGGNTFVPTGLPSGTFATAVAISSGFAQDQTVFAASYVGLYKSTDGGNTWVYTKEPARQEELRSFPSGEFSTIIYQGSWPASKNTAYSTQQIVTTTQSGATASLTFLGSGAEWVGLKSTTGGTAEVMLDGVLDATVNLSATKSEPQQVLWQHRGLTCGVHTVTIKATPAAGKNVTLDALDVWQDTCGL